VALMVKVVVTTVIEAPLDRVWAVIRAFNDLSWFPAVAKQNKIGKIEDGKAPDQVGAIRHIVLDNGTLREKLLSLNDTNHTNSYSILDGPLPVVNYVAGLHLEAITTSNQTFVTWWAEFDSPAGVDPDIPRNIIRDAVFNTCLKELNNQLKGSPRITRQLHTMLRVGDLQRSIKFYTEILGMKFLRTADFPEEEYTLAFVGYGAEDRTTVLEFTYNYGKTTYEHGGAYGHICLAVPAGTLRSTVEHLKTQNVTVDYLSDDNFMAFIRDPDNYQIEILDEEMFLKHASKTA